MGSENVFVGLGGHLAGKVAALQTWLMEVQSERMLKKLGERERLREAVRERRATAEQLTKHARLLMDCRILGQLITHGECIFQGLLGKLHVKLLYVFATY